MPHFLKQAAVGLRLRCSAVPIQPRIQGVGRLVNLARIRGGLLQQHPSALDNVGVDRLADRLAATILDSIAEPAPTPPN